MKTCKGCGAFYEHVCTYCGYSSKEAEDTEDKKFATLSIIGDRNYVFVKYGDCVREKINMVGDRQKQNISAEYINIIVRGDRNKVDIHKDVKYFIKTVGDRNQIGE